MRAQEIYERDDVTALAQRYGRALTQGLTVADVQAWPDILQEITDEEIMDAEVRRDERDSVQEMIESERKKSITPVSSM